METYEGNKPYIFVSYSHKDAATVVAVIKNLQARGFRVWYDAGIREGAVWPEYIADHLMASECVLAFISRASVESSNCTQELYSAVKWNRNILPVYLEDASLPSGLEMQLSTIQAMFRNRYSSNDSFCEALAKARVLQLCTDRPVLKKPEPAPAWPSAPAPSRPKSQPAAPRQTPAAAKPSGSAGVRSGNVKKLAIGAVAAVAVIVAIIIAAASGGNTPTDGPNPNLGGTSSSSGTQGEPFDGITLKTAEDLQQLANSDGNYRLGNDIDLSGIAWIPIEGFTGKLDGNGCAIKNLTLEASGSDVGFFSVLKGTVTNLKIENANIQVSGPNENVGILCGRLTGQVQGIAVSGAVNAEKSANVGGIIGQMAVNNNSTIQNMTSSADVTGLTYVGGIFGNYRNIPAMNLQDTAASLENCSNSGTITAEESYAGGIAGAYCAYDDYNSKITSAISGLSNTGSVTGDLYVGGIFGHVSGDEGEITDCDNASAVSGSAYVGGLFGYIINYPVTDCRNNGTTVTISGGTIVSGEKCAYAGGYAGYGWSFSGCTNEANITGTEWLNYVGGVAGMATRIWNFTTENLGNTADISGNNYVGGIYGCFQSLPEGNNRDSAVNIAYLTNSGNIQASGDYAGGIFGYYEVRDTYNSTATAALSGLSNEGNVNGALYTGGLIGYVCGDGGEIQDCTNASTVEGSAYVGGLFGYVDEYAVSNCRNSQTTVTVSGGTLVDGVKCAFAGGFAGHGWSFSNCKNEASIAGTAQLDCVGGIAGVAAREWSFTTENLENTANIRGGNYVGGIYGKFLCVSNGNNRNSEIAVDGLSNSGEITASGNYAGGIFGYAQVEDDYNSTALLYAYDLTNNGAVSGAQYVGGVIGYVIADGGTISGVVSTGVVTGTAESGECFGKAEKLTIKA